MVKVCLMCQSVLLELALKKFLKQRITTFKESDVVITDRPLEINKPFLLIGSDAHADLQKPFTHASLLLQLEKFEKRKTPSPALPQELLHELDRIHREYRRKITAAIRRHVSEL